MDTIHSKSSGEEHKFHYQPLADPGSSIRLIEVQPDTSRNDRVQLRILESPLSEDYTCLSYVWGPRSDQHHPILLNGKTFHVRQNLYDFLCIARRKYPERKLWIDAICINQTDTTERNHQVQQMGEIYSRAREVIAWLGNDYRASEFIPRLNNRCRRTFTQLPANFLNEVYWRMTSYVPVDELRTRKATQQSSFARLIHSYWKRAWVTQEITLARHVRVLVNETEFDLFDSGPRKIGYFSSTYPLELLQMYEVNTQDGDSNERHLLNLLRIYGHKLCAEDRDRVFSLLYICVEGADMQVDYSSSEMEFFNSVLRISRLTPCLCSAKVVYQCIKFYKMSWEERTSLQFIKLTIQPRGFYTYQSSKSEQRLCCIALSVNQWEALSLDGGQIFCLADVCSVMHWHLVLIPRESQNHLVKAVLGQSSSKTSQIMSLGENGGQVEICGSSLGDSYTIKLTYQTLFRLSGDGPGHYVASSELHRQRIVPSLCEVARKAKCKHSVEYLGLGD